MNTATTLTFVALGAVFLALIILAITLSLFSKVNNLRKYSENNVDSSGETASILETDRNEGFISSSRYDGNDEIIAVLTAAVLAVSNSRPGFKLKVKSFRRIPQTSPIWNIAGREEQISTNF
jgi:Na+-transporting methylmalonyl-CoA/oxaloacetate decarboxylase gamma subunit